MLVSHLTREGSGGSTFESALQAVIYGLLGNGFDSAGHSLQISIASISALPGRASDASSRLEDDPDLRTVAFISNNPVAKAGGGMMGAALARAVPFCGLYRQRWYLK